MENPSGLVWKNIEAIRASSPLVHNITNYVTMNPCANALLALGASPVMAHALEEVEEMTALASALVVNIGTLSGPWIEAMCLAVKVAAEGGIPVVLDPVGAGATRFRTETARMLATLAPPAVIRGNASEIMSLCKRGSGARGVDSRDSSAAALESARELAREYGCVVSVSGATDYIADSEGRLARVNNSVEMMTRITGMGCVASAITAAFCAVGSDCFASAAAAMATVGIAGEIGAAGSSGPGTLESRFIDALYNLSGGDIEGNLRMEW